MATGPVDDSLRQVCCIEARNQPCEDIHGVVRAQRQQGCNLEENQAGGDDGQPALFEARQHDRSDNGDRSVTGKKVIVGDAVGDDQRRKSRVAPDRADFADLAACHRQFAVIPGRPRVESCTA